MSSIKHRIKAAASGVANLALKPFGYQLQSAAPWDMHIGSPHRLSPEPRLLLAMLLRRIEHPTFIQVGAFDGSANDPIHPLVLEHGLSGVVVEPQPYAYKLLQQAYASQPQVICENIAISQSDSQITLYAINEAGRALYPMTAQIASVDSVVLEKHRRYWNDIGSYIEPIVVPCLTLASLMRKHSMTSVDVIWIDTEGYDYKVLQTLDFSSCRPSIIGFEHKFLSTQSWEECVSMLISHGYKVARLNADDTVATTLL